MTESTYIPGMCNINQAEIRARRKAMWFGIIATATVFMLAIVLHAAWWVGIILLFLPAYIAAIGFLQVRNRFCVSYGSNGYQNADEGSTSAKSVEDADAVAKDKRKTRTMNLQALGMTLAVVAFACAILYVL